MSYDSASRVVVQGDSGYGFDDLDRVVAAVSALGAQGYAYDANGNRTAMTLGATVFPYAVDPASNRLVSVGGPSGWALGHDANGSIVSDGARQFAYDARGRLVRVERGAAATAFEVDARGLRVRKSGPLGERFFHYDPAGRLIAESDANGSFDREYLYLDALPVALLADGAMYHIDTDHLGTPRWLSNGAGNNVWHWLPGEPFGIQAPAEDPSLAGFPFVFNLRFPGQYFDGETLLHYNFHRDYDPATGRYIQSDPIGLAGGVNTYTYVNGNPLSYTDPTGNIAFIPIAAAVGAAVGGLGGAISALNSPGATSSSVLIGALAGAAGGATAGIGGISIIGSGIIAAGTNALGQIANSVISCQNISPAQVGVQGVIGGLAGGYGQLGGMGVAPALQALRQGYSSQQAVAYSNGVAGLVPTVWLNLGIPTNLGGFFPSAD